MTAIAPRSLPGFLSGGAKGFDAALVYGPDQGLVRERADALARAVVPDFRDPFNYIEIGEADLKAEPARLLDEAAALSFAGGRRVVRLRAQGQAGSAAACALVEAVETGRVKPEALVVVEAGELPKTSALRKAFEKAKKAAALPCYPDGPAEVRALALDMARAEGLSIDEDALSLLVSTLGDDRGVTRSELEKLVIYKCGQRSEHRAISLADARAVVAEAAGEEFDDAAAAAAEGDAKALARTLFSSTSAGGGPIGLLRALLRQFQRLREAKARISAGETPFTAMMKLRPPVFQSEQRAFEARLKRWTLPQLEAALDMLLAAEFDAKTTGAPQKEIAERAAFKLCGMAL
jgi:DNA polymerase-3 subunit delta